MVNNINKLAKKELNKLTKLIYKSKPTIRPDYVVGFYRYWAEIDAIKNLLLKKRILKKEEINKELIPIIKAMKKDFE